MLDLEEIYKEVDKLNIEEVMSIMKSLINIKTVVPPGNNYQEYVDVISPLHNCKWHLMHDCWYVFL